MPPSSCLLRPQEILPPVPTQPRGLEFLQERRGCHEVETTAQVPTEAWGTNLNGDTTASSCLRTQKTWPGLGSQGGGGGGEGQSVSRGDCEKKVSGRGRGGGLCGKRVPSLQAMASFPSSTQTAAGTGRGLLLKHWWLQALVISDILGLSLFLGSFFLPFFWERPPVRAQLRGGAVLFHLHREWPLSLQGSYLLILPFKVF